MGFDCKRCGACCRAVGKLIQHLPLVYGALFAPDEKGICRFLKNNNNDNKCSCSIYDMRPPICDVGWVADNKGPTMGLSDEAFVEMTEKACELLRNLETPVTGRSV